MGMVTFPDGWWTSLALSDPESQRLVGDTRVFENHTKKGVNCNTTTQVGCYPDDFHDRIDNETIIQQCFIKGSCIGGHNITCKVGYTGPLCASCDTPTYVMVGGQCVACEGNANPDNFYTLVGIVMGIIGFLFLLIAILGPICYFKKSRRVEDEVTDSRLQDNKTEAANDKAKMKAKTKILTGAVGEQISTNDNLSTGQQAPDAPAPKAPSLKKQKTVKMEGTQTNFQAFIKVLKWMKSEKLKIAFSFFQVLNVFESNFSIPWPQDVAAILSGIKFLNLSFAEALKLGCYASNGNFYTTFSIMMFTPIVLTAFIACVCILGLCYAKCRRKADKLNWVALCFRFWGLMVFAIFPSLNSILFQVFESVNVDGHWFLRRDMTINCDADNQERTNMLV